MRVTLAAVALTLTTLFPRPVAATPLTVDGGWHLVEWNCVNGLAIGWCDGDLPTLIYEFHIPVLSSAVLTFTDMFTAGDAFDIVIDNNVSRPFRTETLIDDPGYHPPNCASFGLIACDLGYDDYLVDPDRVASYFFDDGRWARLVVPLSAGAHTVAFYVVTSAPDVRDSFPGNVQTSGRAAIRVDTLEISAQRFGALRDAQDVIPAPEPASMLLLATGLAGVAAAHRRHRR